jgi:hypothetical protein
MVPIILLSVRTVHLPPNPDKRELNKVLKPRSHAIPHHYSPAHPAFQSNKFEKLLKYTIIDTDTTIHHIPLNYCTSIDLEVVSKPQIAFESEAQADEKAQHTCGM